MLLATVDFRLHWVALARGWLPGAVRQCLFLQLALLRVVLTFLLTVLFK